MKENTRVLLTILSDDSDQFRLSTIYLPWLLPELSPAGRRSLVHHAIKQSWIRQESVAGRRWLAITPFGQRRLERLFPALRPSADTWQGDWSLITFLRPPSSDRSFRYLRHALLKQSALGLSRGTYLIPGALPLEIMELLDSIYRQSVMVARVGEWSFGDVRAVLEQQLQLSALSSGYSGISTELAELLLKDRQFTILTDQQKTALFSVFNRLYSLIQKDHGLLFHFQPQTPSPQLLIRQFQTILDSWQ